MFMMAGNDALTVLEESSLNLSGRQTVARHVHNVVDTATDPVVAVVIATSAISRELRSGQIGSVVAVGRQWVTHIVTLVDIQVSVHVTFVGTPDGAGHAGPGLLEGQNTLDIVAGNLLARDRVDDGGLNSEERQRGTTGLSRSDTTQRCDHVGTSFGLPVGL